MIVDRRRIERLGLLVPRATDVPRIASTVQEALRLASLPGDGHPGRLYVRRLELPQLRLGTGPQSIAHWIGVRVRELRHSAVAISHRRAATAPAVIARDPVESLLVALVRSAVHGRRLTEWFWPHVDPQLVAERSPASTAAVVWRLLATRVDAPVVVPAIVGALLDIDRDGVAFATIDPVIADVLMRAIGAPTIAPSRTDAALREVIAPRWVGVLRRVTEAWGHDTRTAWLVTAASRATRPRLSSTTVATLVEQAHARIASSDLTRVVEDGPQPVDGLRVPVAGVAAPRRRDRAAPVPTEPIAAIESPSAEAVAVIRERPTVVAAGRPDASTEVDRIHAPHVAEDGPPAAELPSWSVSERAQPTAHGGLYFLLRPLTRLGLPELITGDETLERAELGVRVLAHIADVLGIPVDDPIRIPLRTSPPDPAIAAPPPPSFEMLWPDPRERPVARGEDPWTDHFDAWRHASAAWLRRHAELDLPALVHRPAAVMCTRTHVDVVLDMETSDVRIRRAALDIDPGWVRWLGRVVSFHYVFGGVHGGQIGA